MSKRGNGEGSIAARGEGSFRLRYRIDGRRFAETFRGSRSDAIKRLRELLKAGDDGQHVAPTKLTFGMWVEQWLEAGAPGQRKKRVGARTSERYSELLRCHALPVLGDVVLQKIAVPDIDRLYGRLEGKRSPRTIHHLHVALGACLGTAVRKGLLVSNPVEKADAPSPGESDHGSVLDETQLVALVQAFEGTALHGIVAVAAFTGARRNEILALRRTDLSVKDRTLSIARTIEDTAEHGQRFKKPKTGRGERTITIDGALLDLLLREREIHRRLVAGVPDGAAADLSLVKLPEDALMFPGGGRGELTKLRRGNAVTRSFAKRAHRLGFPGLRFHDLRGSHETVLLDRGIPLHVVAARCGHDPAVMLRSYAKRTAKADTNAADVIGGISKAALVGPTIGPRQSNTGRHDPS
jgi:integrase